MDDIVGDRVPVGARLPGGLRGRQAPDRTLEVGSVPGLLLIAFVDDPQQKRISPGKFLSIA